MHPNHANLADFGLGTHYLLATEPTDGPCLGRVICHQANRYEIATIHGLLWAEVSGRLSYAALDETELPAVGDWVLAWWDNPADARNIGLIMEICPRQSVLSRVAPGGAGTVQILATNVEHLVVVWPLDHVEAGRVRWGMVQRFLTLARSGGIQPILVLSKADVLSPADRREIRSQATTRWPGLPVLVLRSPACMADEDEGTNTHADLLHLLGPASTTVLAGLSGAGKSTLLNDLAQAGIARVEAIRDADHKGRHTTTHRELHVLPNGALVIDSPGIRELGIVADDDDLDGSFGLISELSSACRFADCRHEQEPGCAVLEAVEAGQLPADLLEQYHKQRAELARAAARQMKANLKSAKSSGDQVSWQEYQEATTEQRRWKEIHKSVRQFSKENRSKG